MNEMTESSIGKENGRYIPNRSNRVSIYLITMISSLDHKHSSFCLYKPVVTSDFKESVDAKFQTINVSVNQRQTTRRDL